MFTVEDRERVRARVLELAAADRRVVAGATVGSLANSGGDRFSDLDLSFGVAGCESVEVLDGVEGLLGEADEARELAMRVEPRLRELVAARLG